MSKDDVAVHAVDAEILTIILRHRWERTDPCCTCGLYFNGPSYEVDRKKYLEHLASMIAARFQELG